MTYEEVGGLLRTGGWALFGAVTLFFAIVSVILNYHWTHYGVYPKELRRVRLIYFGVSAVLLVTMATFLFLLTA